MYRLLASRFGAATSYVKNNDGSTSDAARFASDVEAQ